MTFAIIGNGAIAQYVLSALRERGHCVSARILRPERVDQNEAQDADQPRRIADVDDMPAGTKQVIDCAGHSGLSEHGQDVLRKGYDLTTLSLGALADQALADALEEAAKSGGSRLYLASGAIGALDCLSAANIGDLEHVSYVGRKPPMGWTGSPAEDVLDLSAMDIEPVTHFLGSARSAAIKYPKNANVASAVAIAGLGFDKTEVTLIADPTVSHNIHEIHASGDFGRFAFRIEGNSLPGSPRSSSLAAMSAVRTAERAMSAVVL